MRTCIHRSGKTPKEFAPGRGCRRKADARGDALDGDLRNAEPTDILHVRRMGTSGYLTTETQKVGMLAGLGSDYALALTARRVRSGRSSLREVSVRQGLATLVERPSRY